MFFSSLCQCVFLLASLSADVSEAHLASDKTQLSLREALPTEPLTLLGLEVELSCKEMDRALRKMGLQPQLMPNPGKSPFQTLETNSLPDNCFTKEGKLRLHYYEGEFYRLDCDYAPTYANFATAKSSLHSSLGKRFSLEKEKEGMDQATKGSLAQVKSAELDPEVEEVIRSSVLRGQTFYYATIKDSSQQLRILLSYTRQQMDTSEIEPLLRLSYIKLDTLNAISATKQRSVLPE